MRRCGGGRRRCNHDSPGQSGEALVRARVPRAHVREPGFDDVEDSEWDVTGRCLAEVLAAYDDQCARTDEILAAHGLDEPGQGSGYAAAGATLGRMVMHMLEETARHAGHLDLIRELLDGQTGYY